ncbi:MAG: virulence protein RhuM/Fic/DOC family protein [bacterium]|nr:virulence protein RhuM/Fic/DOC family protein [bacterium]
MSKNRLKKGQIKIYKTSSGPKIEVHLEEDTVWLRQEEIAELFNKDRSVISKHINKIFSDKEVDKKSNVHFLHIANSDKPVAFYSLDVILSVGYRTNSNQAIHFRKWSTKILKDHLIKGYTVNEKIKILNREKFREFKEAFIFIENRLKNEGQITGQETTILNLIISYTKTFNLLEEYDRNKLIISSKKKVFNIITYEDVMNIVNDIKRKFCHNKEYSKLFGKEAGDSLKGIIGNIHQTFKGKDLYSSVEEKAAHLLYFIIKDHPFIDGNKRIGSFLFIYFLDRNNFLFKKSGERKINDNALIALSLLIALSDPKDKDILIKIITNLIGD